MENILDEYHGYWETNMSLQMEEFESWGMENQAFYGSGDSSSPDGASSSLEASKNIVSERNRRKKLNDKLLALRAVVPNITKMDKASIIKDAIEYIHVLLARIKSIEMGILDLESTTNQSIEENGDGKSKKASANEERGKAMWSYPIEVVDLSVSYYGEKTMVVSLKCGRREDTTWKICKLIQSLNLNIISASINVIGDFWILNTLFVQAMDIGGVIIALAGAALVQKDYTERLAVPCKEAVYEIPAKFVRGFPSFTIILIFKGFMFPFVFATFGMR